MSERDELVKRLPDLAKKHRARGQQAMNNLCCGSENWEYREANREADFCRDTASALDALAETAATIARLERQLAEARENATPFDALAQIREATARRDGMLDAAKIADRQQLSIDGDFERGFNMACRVVAAAIRAAAEAEQ